VDGGGCCVGGGGVGGGGGGVGDGGSKDSGEDRTAPAGPRPAASVARVAGAQGGEGLVIRVIIICDSCAELKRDNDS